jgi:hypothetical protein
MSDASEHKAASKLAASLPCLLCGKEGNCNPAHLDRKGMGGSKHKWTMWKHWIPLCSDPFSHDMGADGWSSCHAWYDGDAGIGFDHSEKHERWIADRIKLKDEARRRAIGGQSEGLF